MPLDDQLLDELLEDELDEFEELLGILPHLPEIPLGEQFLGGQVVQNPMKDLSN